MTDEKDDLMNDIVRGTIQNGDIYFYVGYDFEINDSAELIFFKHLKELVEKLNLKPNAKIFGGLFKDATKTAWDPRKKYGEVKDFINK